MKQHMKFGRFAAALMLAAGVVAAAVAQDVKLKIGDPAPALSVAKWVKGAPVAKFEPGKVYVVEFWATWCGPCKVSIPHLTELAKKYEGKATFTGVSVYEEQKPTTTAYMDKVDKFVKDMGPKMEYNVAVDGLDMTMAHSWMEAAGQGGIPTAFVVNQDGKIAWIGHPMAGLDEVVGKVVEGKYDLAAAAKAHDDEMKAQAKAEENNRKMAQLLGPVQKAVAAKDLKLAVKEIDKIVAEHPEMKTQLAMGKFTLLLRSDEPAAYAYARQLSNDIYKDQPMALNQIAWTIVDDQSNLKKPDYNTAIMIAQKAVDVSKPDDPTLALTLDTLGYALFKAGKIDKAVEVQTRAVSLLDKAGSMASDQDKKDVKDRLAKYKAAKKGG